MKPVDDPGVWMANPARPLNKWYLSLTMTASTVCQNKISYLMGPYPDVPDHATEARNNLKTENAPVFDRLGQFTG